MDISNLEELEEGVSESFESLAALAVQHLALTEDTPITELCLHLLCDLLIFATRLTKAADNGSDPPNSARCLAKAVVEVAVKPLIHTLCMLNTTTDPDPGPVINEGFSFFLQALSSMPKMCPILPTAIDAGLIGDISL
ncbi:hypothetical protein DFH09DRAFT_1329463 [Mycena vulgaris]|nr:hypothetical protein DFH09DRAFT_1329463 [Mycena vulgaris]